MPREGDLVNRIDFLADGRAFWALIEEDRATVQAFYEEKREDALQYFAKLQKQIEALHETLQTESSVVSEDGAPASTTARRRKTPASTDGLVDSKMESGDTTMSRVLDASRTVTSRFAGNFSIRDRLSMKLAGSGTAIRKRLDVNAQRKLRQAFKEYYRALGLLQQYQQLNRTAFSKILKKYDKVTFSRTREDFLEQINTESWVTDRVVDELMVQVEV